MVTAIELKGKICIIWDKRQEWKETLSSVNHREGYLFFLINLPQIMGITGINGKSRTTENYILLLFSCYGFCNTNWPVSKLEIRLDSDILQNKILSRSNGEKQHFFLMWINTMKSYNSGFLFSIHIYIQSTKRVFPRETTSPSKSPQANFSTMVSHINIVCGACSTQSQKTCWMWLCLVRRQL